MRISRVIIQNFRNFKNFDVTLSDKIVLLGENGAGKTNFIDAIRVVLDSSFRPQLGENDFHNDITVPKFRGTIIQVDVFFEDFASENDEDCLAIFQGDSFCQDDPPMAQVSFQYRPKPQYSNDVLQATNYEHYESIWYVGGDTTKSASKVREYIHFKVVKALRDIENDLHSWQRSPLRRLTQTMNLSTQTEFQAVAQKVQEATDGLRRIQSVRELQEKIQTRVTQMIEGVHAFDPQIGMLPTNPDDLQKYLTFLVENELSLDRTSLGLANILYLTLLMVEIELLRESQGINGERRYTILAIDEPEAHLHPHLQRLVFRDFLQSGMPIILSTHSPNIVSIAEPDWFLVMQRKGQETIGKSTASLKSLDDSIKQDLSRYLDVNRGESVFAKGVMLVEGDAEQFLIPSFAQKMKEAGFITSSLDGAGISVVNVSGTDFMPYVRFFGPEGLDLPIAIITDGDVHVGLKATAKQLIKDLDGEARTKLETALSASNMTNLRSLLQEHKRFVYVGLERAIEIVEIVAPFRKALTEEQVSELQEQVAILRTMYANGSWDELRDALQQLPEIPVGIFVNEWTLEQELIASDYKDDFCAVYAELGASERQVGNMRRDLDNNSIEKLIKRIEASGMGKGRFAQRLASKVVADRIPDYIQQAISHVVLRTARVKTPLATASPRVDEPTLDEEVF